ncbi:MAG: hypothetical protein JWO22_434 [Frankiales bacterium]|nr:hypothetical protein [Frankiales bacterium]
MAHTLTAIKNDAPVTIPVPRTPDLDWPGDGTVAHVPAALMLAVRGRCSCDSCVDGFVHMMRRARLKTV